MKSWHIKNIHFLGNATDEHEQCDRALISNMVVSSIAIVKEFDFLGNSLERLISHSSCVHVHPRVELWSKSTFSRPFFYETKRKQK